MSKGVEEMLVKKGSKSKKLVNLLLLFVVLASCLLYGCDKKDDNKVKLAEKAHLKAVFERNNDIYIYDEKKEEIKVVGDQGKRKELLVLSPNHKNIVYRLQQDQNTINNSQIVIQNIKKEKTDVIDIEDEDLKNITEIKWLDDEHILVTAHMNPSVSSYGIYDINSKKQVNSIKGILMGTYDDGQELLHSKTKRNDPSHKSNLYINDKLIYEMENSEEQIQDAVISKDYSKIVFKTFSLNLETGEVKDYIYSADFNEDYKISNIEKTELPPTVFGILKLDEENNLYIINDKAAYKVQGTFFTETKYKEEGLEKPTEEKLTKFKQTLAKNFPKEFITDYLKLDELQIYNIQWF